MQRVYATQDNDGHWYVIPYELKDAFFFDLEEDMDDIWFGERYGQYMTGGDLNNVELYADFSS